MKNIIKKITSIFVVSVMAMLAVAIVNAETMTGVSDEHKDYTQSPHYTDLLEWFDRYDYTEEQRTSFMSDTETMDLIMYDDNFWNYGNDDNAVAPAYVIPPEGAVSFPIKGYESGKYFSKAGTTTPCTHHSSWCSISGSCGCKSFNNGIQCYGFAHFVYWTTFSSYFSASNQIGGLSSSNWSADNIKDFIKSNLRLGSHIRLHLRGKSDDFNHSVIISSKSSTGIEVYDANWDGKCGIRMVTLTWSNIYSLFDKIVYCNY